MFRTPWPTQHEKKNKKAKSDSWLDIGHFDRSVITTVISRSIDAHSRGTVYSSQKATHGKHEWRVEILQNPHDNLMVFGVASNTDHYDTYFGVKKNGAPYYYAFGTIGGQKTSYRDKWKKYGPRCTKGDTIGVHLDLDAQTIAFSKNRTDLGVAFKNINKQQTYRLAVCLPKGTRIQMRSYSNNYKEEEKKEENDVDEKKEESWLKTGDNFTLYGKVATSRPNNKVQRHQDLFGNQLISKNNGTFHEWKVKILKKNGSLCIGIASDTKYFGNYFYGSDGAPYNYGFHCHGEKTNGSGELSKYGSIYYENDVITVHLNMSLKTIQFSRNDIQFGDAFDDINVKAKYRLAIDIRNGDKPTKVEMISYECLY